MSVVPMKSDSPSTVAITGGAMDKVIERKRLSKRLKLILAGVAAVLAAILLWWIAPRGSSQTVPADRLTISEVQRGTFEDFLPLRAHVTPLLTVYLDAVEGGRVDKVLVEDGARVEKGQLLAILTNADLQLSTLRSETDVAEQINNLHTAELNLARTHLENERNVTQAETDLSKARRLYELQAPLAARGFVAGKVFNDTRDDFAFQQKKLAEVRSAQSSDDKLQSSQLAHSPAHADYAGRVINMLDGQVLAERRRAA